MPGHEFTGRSDMKMIPYVDAGDLPPDVEEYCIEMDYPVHCDSAVVQVVLDDPLEEAGGDSDLYPFPDRPAVER